MGINIAGFSTSTKSPGFFAEVVFGASAIAFGSIPKYLVLVGQKATGLGSAVVDVDVLDILSADDADLKFGAGGELAQMAYVALLTPGILIKGAAMAPPGSPTAATATITIAGSWTVAGNLVFRMGTYTVNVAVSSAMTLTTLASAVAAAINALPRFPATASPSAGVVTLTAKSTGARGKDWALYQDVTQLPAGATSTLAGGASLTKGGVRFTAGAGQDSVSNILAVLSPGFYDTIAVATSAAAGVTDTNPALVKAWLSTRGAIGTQNYSHVVYGHNGAYADAQTLAATTLNDQVQQVAWQAVSESHPSQIAAAMAAQRQLTENVTPNGNYNNRTLSGLAPHAAAGDRPLAAQIEIALNNGVTPVSSYDTGIVYCLRAITSHCLSGASADYRTLDVGQAKTPQRIEQVMQSTWLSEFSVANPYVRGPLLDGERDPPAGVAYPALWNARVTSLLRDAEAANWVTGVSSNLPQSDYDTVGKRISSIVPVNTLPINNNTGASTRQVG